jgi:hypothetical protein
MEAERIKKKSKLFGSFPAGTSLQEQINVTVARYNNNYFVDPEDLSQVLSIMRPTVQLKGNELKNYISSNEILRDKKLAWVWAQTDQPWNIEFKSKIINNQIKTLTKAKDEAAILYHYHPDYSYHRATKLVGGAMMKSRLPQESDLRYRKRLAVKQCLESNVASLRNEIKEILQMTDDAIDVNHQAHHAEICKFMTTPSTSRDEKIADLITYKVSHLS